jgi:alcohol dehydrogenase, propanol-preferring
MCDRARTTGTIAVDTDDRKLEAARKHGADVVVRSDASAAEAIRKVTSGAGAELVLDMVAPTSTRVCIAARSAAAR